MNLPWLKTAIFWTIVVVIIFAVFQCTQNSENKKSASTLMYERLYQCAKDLPENHKAVLQHIQQHTHAQLTQKEIMLLIADCKKVNPLQSKEFYSKQIKALN